MDMSERFEALESWAEVIVEALHEKESARVVHEHALRELRQLSWMLRDKLHVQRMQLEYSSEPRSVAAES
jgi:hypothetical protein